MDDLEGRLVQLERDLALAQHNISQLIQWITASIGADRSADARKMQADRRFLDMSILDND